MDGNATQIGTVTRLFRHSWIFSVAHNRAAALLSARWLVEFTHEDHMPSCLGRNDGFLQHRYFSLYEKKNMKKAALDWAAFFAG